MFSRIASLALAATLLLTVGATVEADVAPLQTIRSVDVPRYMGRWYEIAKFPNRFQRQCVSDGVAEYRLLGDGRVEVGGQLGRTLGFPTAQTPYMSGRYMQFVATGCPNQVFAWLVLARNGLTLGADGRANDARQGGRGERL